MGSDPLPPCFIVDRSYVADPKRGREGGGGAEATPPRIRPLCSLSAYLRRVWLAVF